MSKPPIRVDFETEAIVGNPIVNPPKPVGVAIEIPGQEPFYLSWGHPTGNNADYGTAHEYLAKIKHSGRDIVFHNAPFDISVWNCHFPNAVLPLHGDNWRRYHDTLYLVFLADPYADTFSLKPSAERYLNLPASERDELYDWIVANVPEATRKTAGAYISRAPGELVGEYAVGDVVRTGQLFDLLHQRIVDSGMEAAYDRERRIMPSLMLSSRKGIRVDRHTLEHHEKVYTRALDIAEDRFAKALGVPRSALDHESTLADAFESSGAVTEWVYTEKSGKRSMARDNIKIVIPEIKVYHDYIGALSTCLSTFIRPWLEKSATDERLHPEWNQVRQSRDAKSSKGTKTGRMSSSNPNFQNVPTEFFATTPEGLPPLPMMRRYCLPEEGHVWLKRDFSSQEIRILAHFEDGALCEAYRADPHLDPHQMARDLVAGILGVQYSRKEIKIVGFSILYGTGGSALAGQLGASYDAAVSIKNAYLTAMPGIRELMKDVQATGKSGGQIRTWGGRLYSAEPSKYVNGRLMDFAYKLLNYLIQGSAADQTKQCYGDWSKTARWDVEMKALVHDEINISAPADYADEAMRHLKGCMEQPLFDVPMLSEGYRGPNWHDLEKCE